MLNVFFRRAVSSLDVPDERNLKLQEGQDGHQRNQESVVEQPLMFYHS